MALIFTQTDTTATFSISTRCRATSDPKTPIPMDYKDATDGGTAGSTELTPTIDKTSTEKAFELITGAINATSWPGGSGNEITFRLDVTSLNADINITGIYACRLNSAGTSQGTYGSWTGVRTLSTAQVETFTLATTAQGTTANTDRILFIIEATATSAHGDEIIGLTPSQDIDTAISEAAATQTLYPGGIVSTTAFGTPQLDLTIFPGGIASTVSFGTSHLQHQIQPGGIASTATYGTPQLNLEVSPGGIASTVSFGTPGVTLWEQFIDLDTEGIVSTVSFGTPSLNIFLLPAGISTTLAFGTPALRLYLDATGIASTSAFGTPQFNLTIFPDGIASTVAFWTPQVFK